MNEDGFEEREGKVGDCTELWEVGFLVPDKEGENPELREVGAVVTDSEGDRPDGWEAGLVLANCDGDNPDFIVREFALKTTPSRRRRW